VRLWGALVVLVVLGALAGLIVSAVARPVYTATATSFVSTRAAASVSDLQQGGGFAQQIQRSAASMVTTPTVLRPVIASLRLKTTPQDLAKQVRATNSTDTALLQIAVSRSTASEAATIANAIQTELAGQIRALRPPGGDTEAVELNIVRPALTPEQPSSPNVPVDLFLGALAGGVLWFIGSIVPVMIRAARGRGPAGVAAPSMFGVPSRVARDQPVINDSSRNSHRVKS
jgi:capsular polysaccharide biosynthesis protein